MRTIYKSDIGLTVALNAGIDLTAANPITIQAKKPDGTLATWSGTLGADKMTIEHIIQTGELDQTGYWKLQAKAVFGNASLHGENVTIKVNDLFTN